MAQIGGVLGELESTIKSERVRAAKDEGARLGKFAGGPRPFGYDDDGLRLVEPEASWYRELFERVTAGEGLWTIARDWSERGIVNRNGRPFGTAALRSMVARPRAAGLRQHRGEIIGVGEWEPVVSPEEQARSVAALASRRNLRANTENRSVRLLSGLIRCECRSKMRVQAYRNGRRVETYRCSGIVNGGGCGRTGVVAKLVEDEVEGRFLARLSEPETAQAVALAREAETDVRALLDELEAPQRERSELASDYGAGRIPRDVWRTADEGLSKREASVAAEIEKCGRSGGFPEPSVLVRRWRKLDLDGKRLGLAAYVDYVEIARVGSGGRRELNPDRVSVHWRV